MSLLDTPTLTPSCWLHLCAIALFHGTVWMPGAKPSVTFSSVEEPRHKALIAADIASVLCGLGLSLALDAIGLVVGLLVAVASMVLGIALLISANSIGTLSVGQVFYSIGYTANALVLSVLLRDTCTLRARGVAIAFLNTPLLFSTYVSPFIYTASTSSHLSFETILGIMCGIIGLLGAAALLFLSWLVLDGLALKAASESLIDFLAYQLKRLHVKIVCCFGIAACTVFLLAYSELIAWYTTLPAFFSLSVYLCAMVICQQLEPCLKRWLVRTTHWLPTKLAELVHQWNSRPLPSPDKKHSTVYSAYVVSFAWNGTLGNETPY